MLFKLVYILADFEHPICNKYLMQVDTMISVSFLPYYVLAWMSAASQMLPYWTKPL